MTNELVQFNNETDFERIAAITGAYVQNNTYLPQLRVNKLGVDNDNNQLPMGWFLVNQNNTNLYAKNASFRVFLNRYQYTKYDPVEDAYTCKSIIISSFNEEALDEEGGVACGKIARANLEGVTDKDILDAQKNIRVNRLLYGIVTLSGIKDSDTDPMKIPVVYRLSGSNFMAPDVALKAITKMKHHYFQHNLELKTKQEKRGSNIYYSVSVNPILNKVESFSDEDLEVFHSFQEAIERENNFILAKWRAAKKSMVEDIDVAKELALDDEIPF